MPLPTLEPKVVEKRKRDFGAEQNVMPSPKRPLESTEIPTRPSTEQTVPTSTANVVKTTSAMSAETATENLEGKSEQQPTADTAATERVLLQRVQSEVVSAQSEPIAPTLSRAATELPPRSNGPIAQTDNVELAQVFLFFFFSPLFSFLSFLSFYL